MDDAVAEPPSRSSTTRIGVVRPAASLVIHDQIPMGPQSVGITRVQKYRNRTGLISLFLSYSGSACRHC